MVELALLIGGALAALALLLWLLGGREPVFGIARGGPHWFVAVKRAGAGPLAFATGVAATWASRADMAFVGGEEAYWSDFLILSGEADPPLALGDDAEDAFIARVELGRPPRLALGLVRALVALGVLSRPQGPVIRDVSALGHDVAHLPSTAAIDALLAKPADYAPAMVNFLQYKGAGGAAAYARYGRVAMRTVYRTGGRLLFYGRIAKIVRKAKAGPCAGLWDGLAAMRYNRPEAILSMEHARDYRAVLADRDEGLLRTVIIASTPEKAP